MKVSLHIFQTVLLLVSSRTLFAAGNPPLPLSLEGESGIDEKQNEISKTNSGRIFTTPSTGEFRRPMESLFQDGVNVKPSLISSRRETAEFIDDYSQLFRQPILPEANVSPPQNHPIKPTEVLTNNNRNRATKNGNKVYIKKWFSGIPSRHIIREPYAEFLPQKFQQKVISERLLEKPSRLGSFKSKKPGGYESFIIDVPDQCPLGMRMDQQGKCREIFKKFHPYPIDLKHMRPKGRETSTESPRPSSDATEKNPIDPAKLEEILLIENATSTDEALLSLRPFNRTEI